MLRLAAISTLIFICLSSKSVQAQVTCIQTFFSANREIHLGFAPGEFESIVIQAAGAMNEDFAALKIIPCDSASKVQAYIPSSASPPEGVPRGAYILYNPQWVNEVIGYTAQGSQAEPQVHAAIIIIGHELGHISNLHFTANQSRTRLEKETEADEFAGCVASTMNVPWKAVEDLLSRIRMQVGSSYPTRNASLEVAKQGYNRCSGNKPGTVPSNFLRDELQAAVLNDDAVGVRSLLDRGGSAATVLDGNMPAAAFALASEKMNAFHALVLGGADLRHNEEFTRLVSRLVENPSTDPNLLRAVLTAGAPIGPDALGHNPACIATRQMFRAILAEFGGRCIR